MYARWRKCTVFRRAHFATFLFIRGVLFRSMFLFAFTSPLFLFAAVSGGRLGRQSAYTDREQVLRPQHGRRERRLSDDGHGHRHCETCAWANMTVAGTHHATKPASARRTPCHKSNVRDKVLLLAEPFGGRHDWRCGTTTMRTHCALPSTSTHRLTGQGARLARMKVLYQLTTAALCVGAGHLALFGEGVGLLGRSGDDTGTAVCDQGAWAKSYDY